MKPSTFYPGIEGLRAIAVMAVIFSHASIPGFSGGFIGVDVFFVISGFLICRLILLEIGLRGKLDLLNFWSRRVRRLLPNAVLLLVVTLAIGFFILPRFMFQNLLEDARMAALQVANYHFASAAVDYFRFDDPPSPLLHFWSLAVEEQFYIVLPISVMLISVVSKSSALRPIGLYFLLTIILSFSTMLYVVASNQPAAFFHSWARAWQLAAGGLVGYLLITRPINWERFLETTNSSFFNATWLGWVGLCSIFGCIFLLDENSRYPGLSALVPTLGAVAVIISIVFTQQSTRLDSMFLSTKPLRWIGERSYSWYLWHWPFIVYAEWISPDTEGIKIWGAVLGVLLGTIAYSFVENPLRHSAQLASFPKRTMYAGIGSIVVILLLTLTASHLSNSTAEVDRIRASAIKDASVDLGLIYQDKCHLDLLSIRQATCEYGVNNAKRRVVLFGDSHAAQWFSGIREAALQEGWSFRSWTKSGCPAMEVDLWDPKRRTTYRECEQWREQIMSSLTGTYSPDLVIISNRSDYVGWLRDPISGQIAGRLQSLELAREGLRRIVGRLISAGVRVVIVKDTPKMMRSYAECFASGGEASCDWSRQKAIPKPWIEVDMLNENFLGKGVELLDLTDRICEPEVCRITKDDDIIWRDNHHLTSSFALKQSDAFRKILANFRESLSK